MRELKLGLIGVGTVGSSLLEMLRKNQQVLRERTGTLFRLVRVCDRSWNTKSQFIHDIPASAEVEDLLNDPSIDVVIELVGGLEPARFWIEKALQSGKSVVTANKALLASSHGPTLLSLAHEKGVSLCFEAAVGGAMPLIQSLHRSFAADSIESFYGILNGTCNYILSKMETLAMSYDQALAMACEKGYAEADPSLDVMGLDSVQKLSILAALAFDIPIMADKIRAKGIVGIEQVDLQFAAQLDYSIRPLVFARRDRENDTYQLSVYPAMIPRRHLLASVNDRMNAILVESLYCEKLIFIGQGAGGFSTASAVISDLVLISQTRKGHCERWSTCHSSPTSIQEAALLTSRFYLRFCVKDRLGIFAEIACVLAKYDISIASLHQDSRIEPVDIVILTHEITEEKMDAALAEINVSSGLQRPVIAIQIEERI